MIASDALLVVDTVVLGFSGTFACISLLGAFYAVPWSRFAPNNSAAKEYNKLWTVRLCLQLTATFWLLCPYLQWYDSWSSYVPALHSSVGQAELCRVHAVLRAGVLEPFFLLLSLLTFKQFLTATESCLPKWKTDARDTDEPRAPKKKNPRSSRIIMTAGFWASLVCLLQLIAPALKEEAAEGAEDRLHLPEGSLTTYRNSTVCWGKSSRQEGEDSGHGDDAQCKACVLPLISTLVSAVIVSCYLLCSWKITVRMGQLAINQSIEKRMRLFRTSVSVLLFFSLLFRGLSIAWEPGYVLHELCKMLDFLAMLFFIMALSFILVIRPIREARIADKSTKSAPITLW